MLANVGSKRFFRYFCKSICKLMDGRYNQTMAMPYTEPKYGVTVEKDVVYSVVQGYWDEGPDHGMPDVGELASTVKAPGQLSLRMDIYLPEGDDSAARPLLLMMHGGAYLIGSKEEKGQKAWCRHFASLGYVAATIDYRLGFPLGRQGLLKAETDALDDARAALGFLLGREDLRIDPERVFAAGTSAGAAMALGLAYGWSGGAATPLESTPAAAPPHFRIRAIANLWGYVRDLSVLGNASVPILSFQSETDPIVPYRAGFPLGIRLAGKAYGTKAIYDKARELGIPCDHVPCSEKAHRLHLDAHGTLTPRFTDIRDRMAAFFAEQI